MTSLIAREPLLSHHTFLFLSIQLVHDVRFFAKYTLCSQPTYLSLETVLNGKWASWTTGPATDDFSDPISQVLFNCTGLTMGARPCHLRPSSSLALLRQQWRRRDSALSKRNYVMSDISYSVDLKEYGGRRVFPPDCARFR